MKVFGYLKSALLLTRLIIGLWPKPAKKAERITDKVEAVIGAGEQVAGITKGALDKIKNNG